MTTANYDDVFAAAPKLTEEERKAAWVERRKTERSEAYTMIDQTAECIPDNAALLTQYLDVQSKFDRYSTANALLISAQNPAATRIADFERWKEDGVFVKKGAKGIAILEPGNEYTREDGSIGVNYNVKRVFDIAQTNAKPKKAEPKPEIRAVLKALVQASPCEVRVAEDAPNGRIASYLPNENVIVVAKGQDAVSLVRCLSQEVAFAMMTGADKESIGGPDSMSYCASYMLCKKFDIESKGYTFDEIANNFAGFEAKEIRGALETARGAFCEIAGRMERGLERGAKVAPTREDAR